MLCEWRFLRGSSRSVQAGPFASRVGRRGGRPGERPGGRRVRPPPRRPPGGRHRCGSPEARRPRAWALLNREPILCLWLSPQIFVWPNIFVWRGGPPAAVQLQRPREPVAGVAGGGGGGAGAPRCSPRGIPWDSAPCAWPRGARPPQRTRCFSVRPAPAEGAPAGQGRGGRDRGKSRVPGLERLLRHPGRRAFRPSLPPQGAPTPLVRPRWSAEGASAPCSSRDGGDTPRGADARPGGTCGAPRGPAGPRRAPLPAAPGAARPPPARGRWEGPDHDVRERH